MEPILQVQNLNFIYSAGTPFQHQALENVSEEHKAAVVLRDVKGLSYEEISEILELSLGTVKSRISRARNQLKTEILKIRERNDKTTRHKKGKEGRP